MKSNSEHNFYSLWKIAIHLKQEHNGKALNDMKLTSGNYFF